MLLLLQTQRPRRAVHCTYTGSAHKAWLIYAEVDCSILSINGGHIALQIPSLAHERGNPAAAAAAVSVPCPVPSLPQLMQGAA